MSDGISKVVEPAGTWDGSISKTIKPAIAKAGSTLRHSGWFEVTHIRAQIKDADAGSYQVTLKAGFKPED